MKTKEYQKIINETKFFPDQIGLAYCALGLTGEAGEVADKIKKLYRDDNLFDLQQEGMGGTVISENKAALIKELGDTLWYLTAISQEIGTSLEEIMQVNVDKLLARRATGTLKGSGDDREKLIYLKS